MQKKGVGSLEFILAFVLFVGFVVAVLYFFNPTKNLNDISYSKDYTINQIIKNTSVELDSYSIVIENTAPQKMKIEILGIDPSKKTSAVDYNGNIRDSSREGSNFCINRETIGNKNFSTLYLSEDIPLSLNEDLYCSTKKFDMVVCDVCTPRNCPICKDKYPPAEPINVTFCGEVCGDGIDNNGDGKIDDFDKNGKACVGVDICKDAKPVVTPTDYQISSSISNQVISEKRVMELKRYYELDYTSVKKQLNIPENVDFSFSLVFLDNRTIASKTAVDISREVFSETKRVEVLRTSGIPQFGQLTVSVW